MCIRDSHARALLENGEIVEARPEVRRKALGQLLFSSSKGIRPMVGEVKPSKGVAVTLSLIHI